MLQSNCMHDPLVISHSQPFPPLPPLYISRHTCVVTIKDATNNRKLCRGDSLFKAMYSDKWSYSYLSQGCAFKLGPCVHSCLATCDTCTYLAELAPKHFILQCFLGCCSFDIVWLYSMSVIERSLRYYIFRVNGPCPCQCIPSCIFVSFLDTLPYACYI